MLKQKVWLMFVMMVSMLMLIGCGGVNWITPNENPVPEALSSSVSFLFYSGQFSRTTAQVSNRLLGAGDITQEEWESVKSVWVEHKKYHNLLQKEVDVLYKKVVVGEAETGYSKIIINYMESVINESDLLVGLLSKFVEDKENIKIPENLYKNMVNFYKLIMEES